MRTLREILDAMSQNAGTLTRGNYRVTLHDRAGRVYRQARVENFPRRQPGARADPEGMTEPGERNQE